MRLAGSPLDTQAVTHLIPKAPTATSASSGGPAREKARVFWPLRPRVAQLRLPGWPEGGQHVDMVTARGGVGEGGVLMALGLV